MPDTAGRKLVEQLGEEDLLFTPSEAAQYYRRSESTLERWRRLGIGPEFLRLNGRVLYTLRGLRAYPGKGA